MVEELVAEGMTLEQVVDFMVATWGYTVPEAWLQVNTALGMPGDVLDSVEDAEFEDDVDDDEEPLVAAGFDESKHPRYESGRREGGRFAPKDGTSTADAQAEAIDQAKAAQASEGAIDPFDISPALEEHFISVEGDWYELGKMSDRELEAYRVWATEVADAGEIEYEAEYLGYAANADQAMKERIRDREFHGKLKALSVDAPAGTVTGVRRLGQASTNPVYVGELDGLPVVIKPEAQLSPVRLRDFVDPGFDLEREQAAAHVAGLLKDIDSSVTPLVPAMRVMDIEGYGRSSVTDYVDGMTKATAYRDADRLRSNYTGPPLSSLPNEMPKLSLYDGIIGNTDRHDGNIMIDPAGRVHAIDHGLAFPDENSEQWPNTGNVSSGFRMPLEPAQRTALEQLRPKLRTDPVLPTLLTEKQIQAMDDRIGMMLHNNRLPNADDWRNAWPNDEEVAA